MSHIDFADDLQDDLQWEDTAEFISLEEAGLENRDYDTVPALQCRWYYDDEF